MREERTRMQIGSEGRMCEEREDGCKVREKMKANRSLSFSVTFSMRERWSVRRGFASTHTHTQTNNEIPTLALSSLFSAN